MIASKNAIQSACAFARSMAPSAAIGQALCRVIEIVASWSSVAIDERFDRGTGPTGVKLSTGTDPLGWIYPGKSKIQIRISDPVWLSAGFPENVTAGSGNKWVHVDVRGSEDVGVVVALAAVSLAQRGRLPA